MNETKRPDWFYPAFAGVLFFAEGFPYGLVNELFPLYLRQSGVSLAQIGLLSTLGLAWTWKVAWSPLVDRFGSYRAWIVTALVVIAAATLAISVVHPGNATLFWTLVAVVALASATQDIAIDAMTVRITPERMVGPVNSARVAAYRGAMIIAGGALAALQPLLGWRGVIQLAAGITIALAFGALLVRSTETRAPGGNPFAGFSRWMKRRRAAALIVTIFLYKLGDFALTPMVKPYWVDRGFSAAEIGTATTIVGLSFLIAGAITGGFFVARFGIFAGLLVLGVGQVLSNVGYAAVATFNLARGSMYAATIVENFTQGLGTAAFLAFLMSVCEREFAATQYAMLSALFGMARSLAGTVSGVAAESLGYAQYFWLTVALGIPGLLILPLVRDELRSRQEQASTGEIIMGG